MPIPTPNVQTTPEVDDSGLDEFGYKKNDEPTKKPEENKTKEPEADKEVEKPATGYGKEDAIPEPEKKEEVKEPTTEEEKSKAELVEALKDLPENIDKEKVTKFALDNKLTKEQLIAYKNFVTEDSKQSEVKQKEAIKAQRSEWKKELSSDPDFGGENFDKNVDRVEKVLENYMPNMKKVLTERGSMLPPYVMRDFLALSKILNPTTTLVSGDPIQTETTDKNFLDDMYS